MILRSERRIFNDKEGEAKKALRHIHDRRG
jgi:hypothetical protein